MSVVSEAQLIQAIQERLITRVAKYKFEPRRTTLQKASNKWRAASAMQKSIRRGDAATAIRMAHALHVSEPDYVWRRLNTVVLEDIGLAAPELLADFLWISTNRTWRNKHGGERPYLYMLIEEMCASIKCRNLCDLLVAGAVHPDYAELRADFKHEPPETIAAIVRKPEVDLIARMAAAHALADGKLLADGKHRMPLLIEVAQDLGCPIEITSIMKWGKAKQFEGMPGAVPLIWPLVRDIVSTTKNQDLPFTEDQLIDLGTIGSYPSCAFDMHNGEGRRALAYYRRACAPIGALLESGAIRPDADPINAIGAVVFHIEGHQVDRRFTYSRSDEIEMASHIAGCLHNGIAAAHYDTAFEVIRANMASLHYARVKVVDPLLLGSRSRPTEVWTA